MSQAPNQQTSQNYPKEHPDKAEDAWYQQKRKPPTPEEQAQYEKEAGQLIANSGDKSHGKKQRKPLSQEQKEAKNLKAKRKRQEQQRLGINPKKRKRKAVESRDKASRKGKIGHTTLKKAEVILEKGSAELQQKVENDEMSIAYAYKLLFGRKGKK